MFILNYELNMAYTFLNSLPVQCTKCILERDLTIQIVANYGSRRFLQQLGTTQSMHGHVA